MITVAKSHILRLLSSLALTKNILSVDHATSEIPFFWLISLKIKINEILLKLYFTNLCPRFVFSCLPSRAPHIFIYLSAAINNTRIEYLC